MKKGSLIVVLGSVTLIALSVTSLTGCKFHELKNKEASIAVTKINNVTKGSNIIDSRNEMSGISKYIDLIGENKEKLILTLNENPTSIDEGGLEFKKTGIRVWFKDYGKGLVVSQIFTQKKDIDFNGVKIGDKISSFKNVLGNSISDKNGETHFKYKNIILSFNYDIQTGDTVCVYFLKEDYDETGILTKPQIEVPVDLKVEENDQKNVEGGHSPWKLDPVFVAQVFVSLKISPEGIKGEYPIKYEELKITYNSGNNVIVDVSAANTPVSRVYLKKLIKQDDTGIWTVVGYDPRVKK